MPHQIQRNDTTGIVHCRAGRTTSLGDLLAALGAPDDLIAFGGVYVEGRRVVTDRPVAAGQLVRVHTRPKRYPVPTEPLRLALDHPEFVVLDKPSGLPTHPTLDNARENAVHVLSAQLSRPLYVTHRLDIPTEGLLVLAKTPEAQALINKGFERNRVEKIYEARSRGRVAPGAYRHFIDPATRVPRAIDVAPREGWWDCRLVVEDAVPCEEAGGWRHRVRLLTGKTHQIRAQFAALGAPLDGDQMYGGPAGRRFGLTCGGLVFPYRTGRVDVRRER